MSRDTDRVRVIVRVSSRSRRPGVGGRYGTGEPPVLLVRVAAPAADGRANEAVVRALADALHVPVGAVRIVHGAASRTKIIEIEDADGAVVARLLDSDQG